jgi:hypothetical protein
VSHAFCGIGAARWWATAQPTLRRDGNSLAKLLLLYSAAVLMLAAPSLTAPAQGASPPASAQSNSETAGVTVPGSEKAHGNAADDGKGPRYHLLGFALRGTKRVNADALVNALPQHEGDVITPAQMKQDTDILGAALKAHHVHGQLVMATLVPETKPDHIWVIWQLEPNDVIAMQPAIVPWNLVGQSFSGNTKLSTNALIAATGLHAGQRMRDGSVGDARTGIEQAYDAALHGAPVDVKGKVTFKKDHTMIINWMITEPK